MKNASVQSLGGNQYMVTVNGDCIKYDLDGFSWVARGATDDEAMTREEFISSDENPKHAEALMDFLSIEE